MPNPKSIAKKYYCYLFALLCILSYSSAQTTIEIDSLLNLLDENLDDTTRYNVNYDLFRKYYRRDIDKAKSYLDEELRIANALNDKERIARSQNHLGIYYNVTAQYEEALLLFQKLKVQYEKEGNPKRVAKSLTNMSNAYRRMGKIKMALEVQMESLEIDEGLGIEGNELANNYFSIGNMHGEIDNLNISTEWYNKAAVIYRQVGNEEFYHRSKHMIGLNYMIDDSLEIAKTYIKEAKSFYLVNGFQSALSMALDNLGTIAEKEGDIKQAISLFDQALILAKKSKRINMQGQINQRIGALHLDQGNYNEAIRYTKNALDISTELNERRSNVRNLDLLNKAYAALDDIPTAYKYQSQYLSLLDSINIEDNRAALEEIEVKYQTEKKEQEIILLEEKAKVNNLKQQGLLGGIVGLVGLIGALLYAMRQRRIKNVMAQEKLDQELKFSQQELVARKQELTAFALQLANKNETLESIKRNVKSVQEQVGNDRAIQGIISTINFNINDDNNWETFRERFDAVHQDFEKNIRLKYEQVTANDMRLMSLLKMNLTSKEIANILNVSQEGVKKARYRLRKKMGLQTSDSLEELIMTF